ncbi:MAG: CarD family transcriptional regulator [Phascolarctobacterium sp.]|nr:CarD family transcriptional regulator [Phascolarctobacterium sp.]MBQ7759749.1 CarD family transcriptional regulator [Acidaminococcaceae bacterium]
MFATGDRVVYPLHGGAIIKEIERREQNGVWVDYFILQMLFENMTVSIPVENADKLGLRKIVSEEKLAEVAAVLQEIPDVQSVKSISWNRRFQIYMEKIKSGCILEVARVFKILVVLEQDKKISVGERRLLHNAKQILQSEIMLVKNIDADQAEAWLKGCC